MPLLRTVLRPVHRLRQDSVRYHLNHRMMLRLSEQLVALLTVASPMSKLHIVYITWMSALCYRNDMIDARSQRMRILQRLIHRFSTDSTDFLRRVDLLLVLLERTTVSTLLVWPREGRLDIGGCSFDPPSLHDGGGVLIGQGLFYNSPRSVFPSLQCRRQFFVLFNIFAEGRVCDVQLACDLLCGCSSRCHILDLSHVWLDVLVPLVHGCYIKQPAYDAPAP